MILPKDRCQELCLYKEGSFLLPVSLPTAPAPFILRRSQLLLPLRLLAPTSCHSWQRHWAIGLFPVSSLRQILGQRAMWITRPFAFAHACPYIPLAIPGKGTGLFRLFPVSSLRQILGQRAMWICSFRFCACLPVYLLPFLAKALGYSVSSPSHP